MITIKDIARESGYSVGTVSRTLNGREGVSDKARERIMRVVDKYGFVLNSNAKCLKQRESHGIFVILKGTENMLFSAITELLQRKIEDNDYECSVYYLNEEENEVKFADRMILERKPEGILFLGSNLEFFRNEFKNRGVPCVLVTNDGSDLGCENLSSISTDDCTAAEYIIDMLISLGHTKIGIVGGDMEYSTAAKYRLEGCMRSFEKHGVPFDVMSQYVRGYFSLESGYSAAGRLFRKMPDITAIFAMSDVTAIGVMRAAADRGIRIPEDLSLVGFDGIDIADFLSPRLTTIRQNREAIASRSLDILMGMIKGELEPVHELVPFSLKQGNSVRDIRTPEDEESSMV